MSRSLEIMGEACAGLQMVRKRMFGGYGYFAPNGAMFAGIVTDDAIVVKLARGSARDELIELGGHPWTYEGRDKPMTMQEWIVVPDAFYDDTDTLSAWLERAFRLVPAKVARSQSRVQESPSAKTATTERSVANNPSTRSKKSTKASKKSAKVSKASKRKAVTKRTSSKAGLR